MFNVVGTYLGLISTTLQFHKVDYSFHQFFLLEECIYYVGKSNKNPWSNTTLVLKWIVSIFGLYCHTLMCFHFLFPPWNLGSKSCLNEYFTTHKGPVIIYVQQYSWTMCIRSLCQCRGLLMMFWNSVVKHPRLLMAYFITLLGTLKVVNK